MSRSEEGHHTAASLAECESTLSENQHNVRHDTHLVLENNIHHPSWQLGSRMSLLFRCYLVPYALLYSWKSSKISCCVFFFSKDHTFWTRLDKSVWRSPSSWVMCPSKDGSWNFIKQSIRPGGYPTPPILCHKQGIFLNSTPETSILLRVWPTFLLNNSILMEENHWLRIDPTSTDFTCLEVSHSSQLKVRARNLTQIEYMWPHMWLNTGTKHCWIQL